MMTDLNAKILVAYRKPSYLMKSDILVPIWEDWHTESGIGDHSSVDYSCLQDKMIIVGGSNKSSHENYHVGNPTLYWIWQNYRVLGDPDYIGLMSSDCVFSLTGESVNSSDSLKEFFTKTQILNDDLIKEKISRFDILLPDANSTKSSHDDIDKAWQTEEALRVMGEVSQIMIRLKPEWKTLIHNQTCVHKVCSSGAFIMKKEVFFEYAQLMFKTLTEYEKACKNESDVYEKMELASTTVASVFFSICRHIYNVAYLDSVHTSYRYEMDAHIAKSSIEESIGANEVFYPAFYRNNVSVVIPCEASHDLSLAVSINSIISHACAENNYDIIIAHTGITKASQARIKSLSNGKLNISVKFLNVGDMMGKMNRHLGSNGKEFSPARIIPFIPHIFSAYDKILCLSSSTIACADIAKLYQINLDSYLAAAAPDYMVIYHALMGKKAPKSGKSILHYFHEKLGISNACDYFQAGVMLINAELYRNEDTLKKIIAKSCQIRNSHLTENDIINSVCHGKVLPLSVKWNHIPLGDGMCFKGYLPESMVQEYIKSCSCPELIHYAGKEKPWNNPKSPLSEFFWRYAINTPFTEQILFKLLDRYTTNYIDTKHCDVDIETVVYTHLYEQKKRKYSLLRFLAKISFNNKKIIKKLEQCGRKLKKAFNLINAYKNSYKNASAREEVELIQSSGLFDGQFYEKEYNIPVSKGIDHYCSKGWKKGYNPNPVFNSDEYKLLHTCEGNPLIDYIVSGKRQGFYVCYNTEKHQASPTDIKAYTGIESELRKSQVVYTCITGAYDDLINHKYINPDWSYVCFTDNDKLLKEEQVGIWTIKALRENTYGDTLNNRYHKLFPHKIFSSEVKRSIYVDANCNILTPYLFQAIKDAKRGLAIPFHFQTACLYEEMKWYMNMFRQYADLSAQLRSKFKYEGFPRNYGMTENNIIYREHDVKIIQDMMQSWWQLLVDFVPRDQLSLSYVLWKNHIPVESISLRNARVDLKNFVFYPHKEKKSA